jgi:hypothetical protein
MSGCANILSLSPATPLNLRNFWRSLKFSQSHLCSCEALSVLIFLPIKDFYAIYGILVKLLREIRWHQFYSG